MLDQSGDILAALRGMISMAAEDSVVTAAHSGRHHTNSAKDSHELEPCLEEGRAPDAPLPRVPDQPSLPLALVLKACPDIQPFARSNLTSWRDFVTVAAQVRGMMGISASAWTEAGRIMGPETAAVAVAAMLQRMGSISNPGGYLRALIGKAACGASSAGPMIMALLNTEGARAA